MPWYSMDPDRYRAWQQIGGGSYGQVWKGEDIITHQPVAMKFLNKQGSTPQQTAALQNDIFNEVKALTAVDHPNIMKLQGAFYIGNYICLVSELADGGSLDKRIDASICLPVDGVHEIAVQLMAGLQHMHSRNLMHGDIKPANILCFEGNRIQICDLGYARCPPAPEEAILEVKGTNPYMSPELLHFQHHDYAVDTWAAGVTLYKAAFGVYPFAGSDTIDFPAAREAIMQGEVYYPSWTPPLLQAFLEALLEKNPYRRLCLTDIYNHRYLTLPASEANQGAQQLGMPLVQQTPLLRSSLQRVAEDILPEVDRRGLALPTVTGLRPLVIRPPLSQASDLSSNLPSSFAFSSQSSNSSRAASEVSSGASAGGFKAVQGLTLGKILERVGLVPSKEPKVVKRLTLGNVLNRVVSIYNEDQQSAGGSNVESGDATKDSQALPPQNPLTEAMAAAKVADAVAEQKVAKAQQLQAVAAHYKQLAEEAAAEAVKATDASDAAAQNIYKVIANAAGGRNASARPATQNQHGQQGIAEDTLEEDSLIVGNQPDGADNTAAILEAVAQHGIGASVEISVNSHSSAEDSSSGSLHAQAAATIQAVRADFVRRHEQAQRAGAEIQHAMPTALELLPPPLQPESAEEARSVAVPLTSFLPRLCRPAIFNIWDSWMPSFVTTILQWMSWSWNWIG